MATNARIAEELPNGPVAAALLAGGIGCAVMGIITTAAEASAGISSALNLYSPVGALSGKVTVMVISFVAAWIGLHLAFRGKNVQFARIATIAMVLLAIGLLGTFPPFFELIKGG